MKTRFSLSVVPRVTLSLSLGKPACKVAPFPESWTSAGVQSLSWHESGSLCSQCLCKQLFHMHTLFRLGVCWSGVCREDAAGMGPSLHYVKTPTLVFEMLPWGTRLCFPQTSPHTPSLTDTAVMLYCNNSQHGLGLGILDQQP